MRFNFKKIAAIGASVLLAGMTTGFAAAAAFPAPFVVNGVANVAIVYGTGAGVSPLDYTQAGNIATSLSGYLPSGGTATLGSGSVALDQGGGNKIWLNTSLNNAKTVYGSSDLPTILGSTTFTGAQTATVSENIYINSGAAGAVTTSDNSGKVIFEKMAPGVAPGGYVDPTVGVSLGYTSANPIYNMTVAFSTPINFTSTQNQGQTLTLFGIPYTVSTGTTATSLVLYGSGVPPQTLNQGNSTTVTVAGTTYTIALGSVSSTAAQVSVNGVTGNVNSGSTVTINGLSVGITNVYPSSGIAPASATILIGANQLTLQNSTSVLLGSANTPILGTSVTFNGNLNSSSGFNIAVYAPTVVNSTIIKGGAFVDPIFGSFQIYNNGLSINHSITSTAQKDIVRVFPSGSTYMQISLTDLNNYSNTITFANNVSGAWNLSAITTGQYIVPYEMANLSFSGGLGGMVLTGTGSVGQLGGHLLQLYLMYNSSVTGAEVASSDWVKYTDVIEGTSITFTGTSIGVAQATIDGRVYTVNFNYYPTTSFGWAEMKFPTQDSSSASQFVLYPTIRTSGASQVGLYMPLNLSLVYFDSGGAGTAVSGLGNNVTAFNLPNGAGFTSVALSYAGGTVATGGVNWTLSISGSTIGTLVTGNGTTATSVNATVGRLTYAFTANASSVAGVVNGGAIAGVNRTMVYLYKPGASTVINEPAVVVFEPYTKDIAATLNAVVIDTTNNPAGISSSPVGVSNVYLTAATAFTNGGSGFQLASNTNWYQFMDYWGTVVNLDKSISNQYAATTYVPVTQVYEQLYIGPTGAPVVSSNVSLGNVVVKDTQVSSFANNNLIVVGGSCINSAAATLVGGAYCGSDWTAHTNVGSGGFLIQSFNSTINSPGLVALLVAGYDAPDTVAAATYLTTNKPDTSLGAKWTGTTSTSAAVRVS